MSENVYVLALEPPQEKRQGLGLPPLVNSLDAYTG